MIADTAHGGGFGRSDKERGERAAEQRLHDPIGFREGLGHDREIGVLPRQILDLLVMTGNRIDRLFH